MAYLEIKKGKAVLQSLLDEDAMSIGRLPGNSIVINDPDISRRHCVVEHWEGKYSIYDLGSRNGTKINGARIQRAELNHGDTITLGVTTVRFLDAALDVSGRRRPGHRKAVWGVAIVALLAAGLVIAWAAGVLRLDDLKLRLGMAKTGDASDVTATTRPENDGANKTIAPEVSSLGTRANAHAEPVDLGVWADRYRVITPEAAPASTERLLNQAVAARFVGKPMLDDRGVMIWELPPDGSIIATLEPDGLDAQRVLTVLANEPMLVEAHLGGRLERDPAGKRLLLRVGVIELLRAWNGKDDALQPATRRLLGERMVLNPRYTAP